MNKYNEKHYENLRELLRTNEETKTNYEDDIICPWCGEVHEPFSVDESFSFMDEGIYEYECCECERPFMYSAHVRVSFDTWRIN